MAGDLAAIDTGTANVDRRVHALVSAVIEGRLRHARDIVRAAPDIARSGLLAATVLGDAGCCSGRVGEQGLR